MDKIKRKRLIWILLIILFALLLCGNPGVVYLGQGFTYDDELCHINYWKRGDTRHFCIPSRILNYKNQRNYILVKQQPKKYDELLEGRFTYPYGRDTTYYWLVNKKTLEVLGPVLYSEMKQHLEETDNDKMNKLLETL